ncbi:MAG: GxxExxY protein [Verrucomicrobia bacterium]|nr:GxxExxY protein [Verrucomicrobiota bacterium]
MKEGDLTYQIIGIGMRVHRELGPGLREKPYENALAIDLEEQSIPFVQQPQYPIFYHGRVVGDCQPDLVVANEVVVDCKSIPKIGDDELGQMLNYLRIAKKRLGLILNFRPAKLEIKRVVME